MTGGEEEAAALLEREPPSSAPRQHGPGSPASTSGLVLTYVEDRWPGVPTRLQHCYAEVERSIWDSGAACVGISSFGLSVLALFVALTAGRVPVFQIVVVRSGLSWLLTLLVAKAQHLPSVYGSRSSWHLLITRGLLGTTAMSLYYISLRHLPLPDAMTIFFVNPAITAVLAWIFRGEILSFLSIAAILASFGGVAVISKPPFLSGGHALWDTSHLIGALAALAAACCAASAYILIKMIPESEPPLVLAIWLHAVATVTSALPLAVGYPSPAVVPKVTDCILLVAIAIASFLSQILLGRGFQLESPSRAAAMSCSQVVFGHFFGLAFLGNVETWNGVVGSLLVALGIVSIRPSSPAAGKEGLGAVAGQLAQDHFDAGHVTVILSDSASPGAAKQQHFSVPSDTSAGALVSEPGDPVPQRCYELPQTHPDQSSGHETRPVELQPTKTQDLSVVEGLAKTILPQQAPEHK